MSSGKKAAKYISDRDRFRLIAITPPEDIPGEKEVLRSLLKTGLCSLHIRKPGKPAGELRSYLSFFGEAERKQMRVHHHIQLAKELGTGGVHVSFEALGSGMLPDIPLSVSVHSWEEYEKLPGKIVEYAFISPVFDSISKPGRKSNRQLLEPPLHLPIPLIALGGIQQRNIRQVREAGYDGAAMLGTIWQNPNQVLEKVESLKLKVESFEQDSGLNTVL